MNWTAATRVRHAEDVLATKTGDTLVLLDSRGGEYYSLEGVGARIWELADGTRSVADIAAELDHEYDAPRTTIESDALELLFDLAAEGLVEGDEAGV
jgi:coenzyme PQQ synthesis protein D (PqqD)